MLVIVSVEFVLGMAVLVRFPGMVGLVMPMIVRALAHMAVGMAVLMQVFVDMGMGMGVAVGHVAMAVGMGMNVAVFVGMLMLVLVPIAVIVMMPAVHVRPPG